MTYLSGKKERTISANYRKTQIVFLGFFIIYGVLNAFISVVVQVKKDLLSIAWAY